MPRLTISGVIPLLPLYAFMAWPGAAFSKVQIRFNNICKKSRIKKKIF
jgi:hypothetical protein